VTSEPVKDSLPPWHARRRRPPLWPLMWSCLPQLQNTLHAPRPQGHEALARPAWRRPSSGRQSLWPQVPPPSGRIARHRKPRTDRHFCGAKRTDGRKDRPSRPGTSPGQL